VWKRPYGEEYEERELLVEAPPRIMPRVGE
jgi:hypothetical protein